MFVLLSLLGIKFHLREFLLVCKWRSIQAHNSKIVGAQIHTFTYIEQIELLLISRIFMIIINCHYHKINILNRKFKILKIVVSYDYQILRQRGVGSCGLNLPQTIKGFRRISVHITIFSFTIHKS